MINALLALVIYMIVIGVIIWLLLYLIDNIPIFEPFRQVARTIIIVVGVLCLIVLLLGFIEPGAMPRLGRL